MAEANKIVLDLQFLTDLLGWGKEVFFEPDIEDRIWEEYRFLSDQVKISVDGVTLEVTYPFVTATKQAEAGRLAERAGKRAGEGDFRQAVSLYERVLALQPDLVDARRDYAMALYELGQYEAATEQLFNNLKLEPRDHWSHAILGNVSIKKDRDFVTAEKHLRKALEIEPEDPWALNSLGAILFETSREQEGEQVFRRLIASNPKIANPYLGLAIGLSRVQKEEEASLVIREMFRRAEAQDIRSKSIAQNGSQLYQQCQVGLAARYQSSVQHIIDDYKTSLEAQSGFPIKIEDGEFEDGSAAKIEIAWRRKRDYHRLLTHGSAAQVELPHLMMHELTHLELEIQAREAKRNRFFATTAETREIAIRSIGDHVHKLQREGIPDDSIQKFILDIVHGLCNFLYNCPLDMIIEKRLYESYSEIRPYQFLSNQSLMRAASKTNSDPQVKKLTPPSILYASNALNGAFALFLEDLFGHVTDFAGAFRKDRSYTKAEELFEHWSSRSTELSPGSEYELVDEFADILDLVDWYEWARDESQGATAEDTALLKVKEPASMFYLLGALERFEPMTDDQVREIAFEVALLGTTGLDFASPEQKYSLRSIPTEKFTGLQLMCLMYAGFKRIAPEQDTGMDLQQAYDSALTLFRSKRGDR
jgi:tetratricopeptide (TPR) repeat protein